MKLNKHKIKERIIKLEKISLLHGLDTWEHSELIDLQVRLRNIVKYKTNKYE